MARNRFADLLQTHRFWLMDVVPSSFYPFFVLGTPLFGFSGITMPEYTADVETIKQVNSMFKRPLYSGGGVGEVTLSRGVRGYDSSFWEWISRAIAGSDVTQRNLLLIQFTNISAGGGGNVMDSFSGPWENGIFLPGKAVLLYDCIPTSYKGGGDLEATNADVSVATLTIQPWAFTEFSLGDPISAALVEGTTKAVQAAR